MPKKPAIKKAKPRKKRFQGDASYIANKRIALGLTQRNLADEIGVCRVHITNMENGKRAVPTSLLTSLARALHCSLEDLLLSLK